MDISESKFIIHFHFIQNGRTVSCQIIWICWNGIRNLFFCFRKIDNNFCKQIIRIFDWCAMFQLQKDIVEKKINELLALGLWHFHRISFKFTHWKTETNKKKTIDVMKNPKNCYWYKNKKSWLMLFEGYVSHFILIYRILKVLCKVFFFFVVFFFIRITLYIFFAIFLVKSYMKYTIQWFSRKMCLSHAY